MTHVFRKLPYLFFRLTWNLAKSRNCFFSFEKTRLTIFQRIFSHYSTITLVVLCKFLTISDFIMWNKLIQLRLNAILVFFLCHTHALPICLSTCSESWVEYWIMSISMTDWNWLIFSSNWFFKLILLIM